MTASETSEAVQVIQGPTAPTSGVQYQVTMPNGLTLTSPSDFGSEVDVESSTMVISEDGQILSDYIDSTDSIGTAY